MKIELHITDITHAELKKIACMLDDKRRFYVVNAESQETSDVDRPDGVSNTPRPKHRQMAPGMKQGRPIIGQKGTELMRWPSIVACAEYFGMALSTILRAIKEDRFMRNGWKLYYESAPNGEEKKIEAEAAAPVEKYETMTEEKSVKKETPNIVIPEDNTAPEWSRKPQVIIGIKGKEERRWPSIYQCHREMGWGYESIKRAAKRYLQLNGWMLMFEEIKK